MKFKTRRNKKKTSISRGLLVVLLKQVFPCFHCFSKTSPTHLLNLHNLFSFRGWGWVLLLIRYIYYLQLLCLNCKIIPKCLESMHLVIKMSVWGVLISLIITKNQLAAVLSTFYVFSIGEIVNPLLTSCWWYISPRSKCPSRYLCRPYPINFDC